MAKARTKLDPAHVQLQLKITLLDIRPAIWRRLLVPAKLKLPQFHTALQRAFGWTNSHLHAFRIEEDSYQAASPATGQKISMAQPPATRRSSACAICSTPRATG